MSNFKNEILEFSKKPNPIIEQLELSEDEALFWLVLYGNAYQGIQPEILLGFLKFLKQKHSNSISKFPLISAQEILKDIDEFFNGRFWSLRDYFYGILTSVVESYQKGILKALLKEEDPQKAGQLLRKNLFYIGKNNPYSSKIRIILHFLNAPKPMGLGGASKYLFIPPNFYWGHPAGLGSLVAQKKIKPWSSKDLMQRIVDLKEIAIYLCKEEPSTLVHWHLCKVIENP